MESLFSLNESWRQFLDRNPALAATADTAAVHLSQTGSFRSEDLPPGEIYPLASPLFLSTAALARIGRTVELVRLCFEDLAGAISHDPELAAGLRLFPDPIRRQFFSLPHGYPSHMPLFRADLAVSDHSVQLMEINTGCPAGDLDGGLCAETWSGLPLVAAFRHFLEKRFGAAVQFQVGDTRADTLRRLLQCYEEFQEDRPERGPAEPTLAIVVGPNQAKHLLPEAFGLADHFRQQGYDTQVGLFDDLTLGREGLYLNGRPIHLILRKFSSLYLAGVLKQPGQASATAALARALLEFIQSKRICLVNPLGSTTLQDKGLLAEARARYPELAEIIPETIILEPELARRQPDLYHEIEEGKNYILKRRISFGGKWFKSDPAEISDSLPSIMAEEPGRWIAQRRLELGQAFFLINRLGQVTAGDGWVNLASFGDSCYVRVSTDPLSPVNISQNGAATGVIEVCTGGSMLPETN
ncbi:MAG: hypothetical protein HQK56_19700 [Deltaproteobacteria bacterium]|nr:hypothetical protein [Deltaproteobacteria bacterium]